MEILIDRPGSDGWSHLVCDSAIDLHVFAAKINIKRYRFHRGKNLPHYDIREGDEFERAVKAGAKTVSSKEIVIFLRQHHGGKK